MTDKTRAEFEADAAPLGFDLTRDEEAERTQVEPWTHYHDEATGHRYAGWQAALATKAAPEPTPTQAPEEVVQRLMTLAMNLGHVYSFVGDESMPIAKRELESALRTALATQSEAAPVGWVKAVQEAYGWLWHINNEPMAPIPLLPEGKAAYQARKALRDLLTTPQRGEAINAVAATIDNISATALAGKGE